MASWNCEGRDLELRRHVSSGTLRYSVGGLRVECCDLVDLASGYSFVQKLKTVHFLRHQTLRPASLNNPVRASLRPSPSTLKRLHLGRGISGLPVQLHQGSWPVNFDRCANFSAKRSKQSLLVTLVKSSPKSRMLHPFGKQPRWTGYRTVGPALQKADIVVHACTTDCSPHDINHYSPVEYSFHISSLSKKEGFPS